MKKLFLAFLILLFSCTLAFGGTYTIPTGTTTVYGNTFCGGACDSSDTIIIAGGPRGKLVLRNFDGNGDYITIKNDPDTRVAITTSSWPGGITLYDCSYVDLRGDNNVSYTYGIKIKVTSVAGVRLYETNFDHIKIGYLEIEGVFTGPEQSGNNGIFTTNEQLGTGYTWHDIELHHNYIHDMAYAGMYLGKPATSPLLAKFLIHDNIFEDLGSYGITYKGVTPTGISEIYNNIIRPSNRSSGYSTGLYYTSVSGQHGIGLHDHISGPGYTKIYNNWIEKTKGSGIKLGDQDHRVYDNILLGCGGNNDERYDNGIVSFNAASGNLVYDNIIVQPNRYAIYALDGTTQGGLTLSRNIICDAGLTSHSGTDSWYAEQSGDIVESAAPNNNSYYSNCANVGFAAWSDDNNYSNDDFTIGGGDPDTDAPTPDPATFSTSPYATAVNEILMVANTGVDATTPVEYQFDFDPASNDCGSDADIGTGGTDCTWQESTTCTDGSLQTNQVYCYNVQMRDSVGTPNVGTASSTVKVYTFADTPEAPTMTDSGVDTITQILLQAITADNNPDANPTTQYAVYVDTASPADTDWQGKYVDTDGTPSATAVWQSKASWANTEITGLNSDTQYGFQSIAKNEDGILTANSATANYSTSYPPPSEGTVKNLRIENIKFE